MQHTLTDLFRFKATQAYDGFIPGRVYLLTVTQPEGKTPRIVNAPGVFGKGIYRQYDRWEQFLQHWERV